MKQCYILISLLLVLCETKAANNQWDHQLIQSKDCALGRTWQYPHPPIPESISDPTVIKNIKEERNKVDTAFFKAYDISRQRYFDAIDSSNYIYSDGNIIRVTKPNKPDVKEQATFSFIQRVYEHLGRFPLKFKEGISVIVCKKEMNFHVYFEHHSKVAGSRVASYNPMVIVERQSGKIIDVVGG